MIQEISKFKKNVGTPKFYSISDSHEFSKKYLTVNNISSSFEQISPKDMEKKKLYEDTGKEMKNICIDKATLLRKRLSQI